MDEYINHVGILRHGNVAGLPDVTQKVLSYVQCQDLPLQELSNIYSMLLKVKLPLDEEELYPYEIPIMIDFLKMRRIIEEKIDAKSSDSNA